MKASTKLIFAAALTGMLGLGTAIRWINAAQTQAPIAIMPESRNGHWSAPVSGKDVETKDSLKEEAHEQKESPKLRTLAKATPQHAQD